MTPGVVHPYLMTPGVVLVELGNPVDVCEDLGVHLGGFQGLSVEGLHQLRTQYCLQPILQGLQVLTPVCIVRSVHQHQL